ncbi:hypothetical protein CPB84DRAFT_1762818 [Gymnopilus junonius]|uniref:Uncharacterized protein n=1 Tax=Gymnopilus junonius TaxID=109634 RepID=A0A9P5NZP4_GYMJU|nr:hypothetical protein CPB84DRAFT_1762818 [Gymnopilus junonius]
MPSYPFADPLDWAAFNDSYFQVPAATQAIENYATNNPSSNPQLPQSLHPFEGRREANTYKAFTAPSLLPGLEIDPNYSWMFVNDPLPPASFMPHESHPPAVMCTTRMGDQVLYDDSIYPLSGSSTTSASYAYPFPSPSAVDHAMGAPSLPAHLLSYNNQDPTTVRSTLHYREVELNQKHTFGQFFSSHVSRSEGLFVERLEGHIQSTSQSMAMELPFHPGVHHNLVAWPSGPSTLHPTWMTESDKVAQPSVQQQQGHRGSRRPLKSTSTFADKKVQHSQKKRKRYFPRVGKDGWAIANPGVMKFLRESNSPEPVLLCPGGSMAYPAKQSPPKPTASNSSPRYLAMPKRKQEAYGESTMHPAHLAQWSTSSGGVARLQRSRIANEDVYRARNGYRHFL